MNFDLIVLGGGIGGYTGALRAAKFGLSVLLVEEKEIGGTCLNRGCIPTKSLLHSSSIYNSAKTSQNLGVTASNVVFDEQVFYNQKDKTVSELREGIKSLLKEKVATICGKGKLKDKNTVEVNSERYSSKFVLLATGSRPCPPKIKGIEFALDTDIVFEKPISGQKIAIIGGGVAGVELASYYANIDKEVVLIEYTDRILPMMSKELSQKLAVTLKRKGIKILTSKSVVEITEKKSVIFSDNETIEFEEIIVAAGRQANLDLGLENAGVKFSKFVETDADMQTNIENIYACGDITGKNMLAHFASASAAVAVDSMLKKDKSKDLTVVPSCVYTEPQIATVGRQTQKCGVFSTAANGMSKIVNQPLGFVKIYEDEDGIISGGEILSHNATEMIGEIALMVKLKVKADEAAELIHAHPTVSECVGEALEDLFGMSVYKL